MSDDGLPVSGVRRAGPLIKIQALQKRLTIFVGESDRAGRQSLAAEIIRRAQAAGLCGASMFRGIEGYGASNRLNTTRFLSLCDDPPMAIVIVDDREAVRRFLPTLDEPSLKV